MLRSRGGSLSAPQGESAQAATAPAACCSTNPKGYLFCSALLLRKAPQYSPLRWYALIDFLVMLA
jgi:threonine/homoserine/homoserine lactone efflux protein